MNAGNTKNGPPLSVWRLFWAPESKPIAIVMARSAQKAVKKTPLPWKPYMGEVYAEKVTA